MMIESRTVERPTPGRRATVHAALGDPRRVAIVDALVLSDRSPSELAELTGVPSNLLDHHLDTLEAAGLIERRPSEGDGRRRYVRLELSSLDGIAILRPRLRATSVLFVCTQNAARSPLAEALWRTRSDVPVASAGTQPAEHVHPHAREVAELHGLDLTCARPRSYDEVGPADLVVSVCDRAGEALAPLNATRLHWSVPDPVPVGHLAAFERAFDELVPRVALLADVVRTCPDATEVHT